MNALLTWLDHRTGVKEILHEALYENIPGGARWRYVWGSTLVFTFVVQMITGVFLWTAYSPSAQTAWESVYFIQNEMTLGWLVRGMHHFAAQAMVVLLALHLMQVIIDGAYKAPREVNFWLGLILMQIVLGLSLTGYLLPWDQKGYYATQVSTEIMGATPVVGPELQQLAQGGSQYGHHTLTRFFAMHAGVLPGSLIFFLVLHIYVFRRHGITVPDPNRAPTATFWPDQILKDGVACLAVLATVLALTFYKGAELSSPADPSEGYPAARPEWYFLFLFRFLKYHWVEELGLAFGAIYLPGLLMLILALMPIIAWWKHGHKFNVGFAFLTTLGIIYLTGLAWYEDNISEEPGGIEFRTVAGAERDAHRVSALAARYGIQEGGAVALLRNDPLTQGPKLFAKNCAACHRYDGHDGTGKLLEDKATAADLHDFGKRSWMKAVLTNYAEHFQPLRNAAWDGENVGERFLDEGMMAEFSAENGPVLLQKENAADLTALLDFFAAQTRRSDIPAAPEASVARGREIVEMGELTEGSLSLACTDCHGLHVLGEEEAIMDPTEDGTPTLTGYGGAQWLHGFLIDPGSSHYYGDNNAMPAFGQRLTEQEMDMLVRWMTGDYLPDEPAVAESRH